MAKNSRRRFNRKRRPLSITEVEQALLLLATKPDQTNNIDRWKDGRTNNNLEKH